MAKQKQDGGNDVSSSTEAQASDMQAEDTTAAQTGDAAADETVMAKAYREAADAAGETTRSAKKRLSGVKDRMKERVQDMPDELVQDVSAVTTATVVGVAAAVIEAELLPGILIGAAAMLVGKMFPRVTRVARPAAKALIRAGLVVSDKARDLYSEAGEQMRDIVAEARSEREQATEARARSRAERRGTTAEAAA